MGKLGFTPIIGLAVVVALALAAVFRRYEPDQPGVGGYRSNTGPTAMAITVADGILTAWRLDLYGIEGSSGLSTHVDDNMMSRYRDFEDT